MQKITNSVYTHILLLGVFVFSFMGEGWSQTTTTYNDNGNIYSVVEFTNPNSNTWTVPANVTSVTVKAWGGGGGHGGQDCGAGCTNAPGGPVGFTEATYTLQPGDELGIHPGGKGGNGANSVASTGGGSGGVSPFSAGYNGGQGGHAASSGTSGGGGGGGAATIIELNAVVVAVAGGAGGGGGMANLANSGLPGSSSTLANGTSNTGGVGASGSSCGKSDGGGAGGGGGGQYGSLGGVAYVATTEECAGNGGYRGSNSVTGAASIASNSFVTWTNNGKVEIIYTPHDLYVDVDATDVNSYAGSGSTWADLSNHNNDLNLVGSPAFNTGFGGFFDFDGTGTQYAEANGFYGSGVFVGSSASPENWNGNSTYEAWVNPSSLNTTTPRLVFGDGNNNEGVIDFRSDRIRAWSSAGIVAEYVASIDANQWYHVVMTHERTSGDNYEIKLFLDGVEVASTTGTTTDQYYGPDNHLRIGYNWDGAISRVKVYNFIRTQTEITDSYDVYKNLYCHFEYVATAPAGAGTAGDPYLVANFENLLWISQDNTRWSQHYLQTADIDASATAEECFNDRLGWSPIGDAVVEFTGSYDGGGFTVSNLNINRTAARYVGLFGKTQDATLENLNLNGTTVADWDAGTLVGYAGGVNGLISNVHTDVEMVVRESGGGLAGHNQGLIENCSAHGNVVGAETNFGGLVGYNKGGKIYRSFATGNISNSHSQKGQVGGLVGAMLDAGAEIVDSYAAGSVTAQANTDAGGVGGLVGRIRNAGPVVVNCFSYGSVSASGGPIGGLIGYNQDGTATNVVASMWDNQTSGQATSAGGTGNTTTEMNDLSTFINAGWDFQCELTNGTNDYWGKNSLDNNGYPFLSWQGYTHESPVAAGVASADQEVCLGGTFQPLALTGSNGTIQWQMSNNNALFADIDGATTTALNLQTLNITEDTWFRAVVADGACTDTSNVVSVEVIQPITSNIAVTACNSYLAPDGQEYGESGEYIAVIPSSAGCDSTIAIDLVVNADIEVSQSVEACGSYTAPDDAVYTSSGQYLAVLPRANGCDSLITVNLTILEPSASTIAAEACNEYTAPDGQQYTESGQYTATVLNEAGCDSVITINLTMVNSSLQGTYTAEAATPGFANGSADLTVTGGSLPYTFQWNDPFMTTTSSISGLFSGNYTCLITDNAGCTIAIEVYVPVDTDVPATRLTDQHCNQTGYELHDFVSAVFVSNAGAYRWKFVEQGEGSVHLFTRNQANPHLRLIWVNGLDIGKTYDVQVKAMVSGEWADEYGDVCTISVTGAVPLTEILPGYRPHNVHGENYALCDFVIAHNTAGATKYRWRFDPDTDPGNGNEVFYVRHAGNPSIRLSWVNNLQPATTYNVAIEAQVSGTWSGFGNVHPMHLADVSNQVGLRDDNCNKTYAPTGVIQADNVCLTDFYRFRFTPHDGGSVRQKTAGNYTLLLGTMNPPLEPGIYDVQVQVQQNGVLGALGPACPITISGPESTQGDIFPSLRSIGDDIALGLFPNPNSGSTVNMAMEGLPQSDHNVDVTIFDGIGKMVNHDQFGNSSSQLNHVLEIENLLPGMYIVKVSVDGIQMATERLIIQ